MCLIFLFLPVSMVIGSEQTNTPKHQHKDLEYSGSDKLIYQFIPTSTLVPSHGFAVVNPEHSHPLANIRYDIDKTSRPITLMQTVREDRGEHSLETILASNPLLAALFLSSSLGIPPATPGFNHPQHPPINPYVALLLSHYGRYLNVPYPNMARGIYGYSAANNYHNNKPFGPYKVYEDA